MTVPEVIHQIEAAWHDVPYPGDDHIFTPDSYDDEDIVNYFGGTTWRGHSAIDLRAHSSAFTFFTPEALHYWFPAFLIAEIQDPIAADVIGDYIPRSLTDGRPSMRWSLFSPAQRQAVLAYLRFQVEHYGDSAGAEHEALRVLRQET